MMMDRLREPQSPNLSVTVFRDSGRSSSARITRLWYDGCEMSSDDPFDVGERIKVAIRGLGSIDAHVTKAQDGAISAHFTVECPV